MIDSKVIIVGGGPAGSTCAWKLKQNNIPTLILDKKTFPRNKICAGWITQKVLKDLGLEKIEYPHQMLTFSRLNYHIFGRKIPVRTCQYAIRRFEFDHWLIKRSGVHVIHHPVRHIRKEDDGFIIDNTYRCKFLVGAGGTNCRVYGTFFSGINPRKKKYLVITMEEEFKYDYHDPECHLWFFDNKLKGYSWYVPKGNGYLNVGIGGKLTGLKDTEESIYDHWDRLVQKLEDLSLVKNRMFKPKGCGYYIREKVKAVRIGNAFIVGDAAGLATLDMGEGIGPAVQSGIRAAEAIISGKPYSIKSIGRYSAVDILFPWLKTSF
ncbi:MAG: NAD(P)/FAD-dependent oxidoreductase [Deltaproteobacteria bacterium]|nr:NAD(P)/FAD-dependent oxidoreductase [Deltaproteobacteria bacterium]